MDMPHTINLTCRFRFLNLSSAYQRCSHVTFCLFGCLFRTLWVLTLLTATTITDRGFAGCVSSWSWLVLPVTISKRVFAGLSIDG